MIKELINDMIEENAKSTPPHELLKIGREYAKKGEYMGSKLAFAQLAQYNEFRDLSKLYRDVINAIVSAEVRNLLKTNMNLPFIVDKAESCMIESTQMYADKEISREDLLTLDTLIDRIPFKEITVENRKEFEMIYHRFKAYTMNVWADGRELIR